MIRCWIHGSDPLDTIESWPCKRLLRVMKEVSEYESDQMKRSVGLFSRLFKKE